MLFNHCYVTNSICTPSRATILSGQHNHANGVFTLASCIDNRLPNVAKHLRGHGDYQTAIIGKWHLGEGEAHEPKGFDYWEVVPGKWHPSLVVEELTGGQNRATTLTRASSLQKACTEKRAT